MGILEVSYTLSLISSHAWLVLQSAWVYAVDYTFVC